PWVGALGGRLLGASLAGGALALLVWCFCRAVPQLPASWRCWLWWGVALKLLVGLLPLPALAVPVLPAASAPSPAGAVAAGGPEGPAVADKTTERAGLDAGRAGRLAAALGRASAAGALGARRPAVIPWSLFALAAWLLGAAVALVRAAVELLRTR